jgi:hypothetical protein
MKFNSQLCMSMDMAKFQHLSFFYKYTPLIKKKTSHSNFVLFTYVFLKDYLPRQTIFNSIAPIEQTCNMSKRVL